MHQLVSSQLDMDRLDYLNRDSFYAGVSEGIISYDRIIKMLEVVNGTLAVEAKGIYSIEKFIIARRLMYWQVYLHKTVLSAEYLLVNILKRARELALRKHSSGEELFATPALKTFLCHHHTSGDFIKNESLLDAFAELDDNDIYASVKVWAAHPDKILSRLCSNLLLRKLYRTELQQEKFSKAKITLLKQKVQDAYRLGKNETAYFVFSGSISNNTYNAATDKINILFKNGAVKDLAASSEQFNISVLSQSVTKHFLCYPKELD